MKKTFILLLIILLPTSSIYYFYLKPANEKQLVLCINNVLNQLQINNISVDEKSLATIPIFRGSAKKATKVKFIRLIEKQCQITKFKDLIKVIVNKTIILPSLNFKIDHFNKIVSITGIVKNQVELDNIINNFTNTYQTNTKDSEWQIIYDIKTNQRIQTRDYDIITALLLPSIDKIRLTDITIKDSNITLMGLVRNKTAETEIIAKLALIFADDVEIINQLELVVSDKHKIENLKIELPPMPKLEEFK